LRRLISYKIQFGFIATIRVRFISLRITHKQRKHIDVRYHKIRQWVLDDKVIDLVNISTRKNLADMVTKTILMEKFRASMKFIKVL